MVLDSTEVEKWSEHSPASCSLKISSFSHFQKSTSSFDHKYISHCFASAGYNWLLQCCGGKKRVRSDRIMGSDSTKVEKWREHAPSSYSLKINSFSQFQKSTPRSDHKYISNCFASGGYNWRLIVYPKGNEKDEGNGFISMYVEIDNESLITTQSKEVYAYLTFSIYNKKQNNYFVIHATSWYGKLNKSWGYREFVSIDNLRKMYLDKEDNLKLEIEFELVSKTN